MNRMGPQNQSKVAKEPFDEIRPQTKARMMENFQPYRDLNADVLLCLFVCVCVCNSVFAIAGALWPGS